MRKFLSCITVAVWLLTATTAFSAEISKIKGKSALIELGGDSVEAGTEYFALNSQGKKKAILVIKKVKGSRAIAKITKGTAEVGMTLRARGKGGAQQAQSEPAQDTQPAALSGRSYWGLIFGFARDSMSVDVVNPATQEVKTADMSGFGFSGKVLFDYQLFPHVWFRGTGGLESFSVSGSNVCTESGTAACDANIYYLTMDGIGRYVFLETGSFHPWLGGGFGLLFPMSKKSSALDSSSITNTSVMVVTGGIDWMLSNSMYVPLSIEYSILPKSDDVAANWIGARAGIAWGF